MRLSNGISVTKCYYVLVALFCLSALGLTGCGSSDNQADQQRAQQTKEARAASTYADETSLLAAEIADLPTTMKKPTRTVSQAKRLKAQAKGLQSEQAPPGNTELQQPYQDLAAANRQLARSAGEIQTAASQVKDGNREPDLSSARKSLRRANRLMVDAYTGIDEYVTTTLAGAISVQRPANVKLAEVKLPPLPDLIFNMTDSGDAQVGDWNPSPENSDFGGAVAVFGPPDVTCSEQVQAPGSAGANDWNDIGLKVSQAEFGAGDPCEGPVQVVEVSGDSAKQWVSEAGLRVGDPEARVMELYPGATDSDYAAGVDERGLVLASTGGSLPREFIALMEGGSVSGMRIWIGGAGE